MFKAINTYTGEIYTCEKKLALLERLDELFAEYQQEFEQPYIYYINGIYYIGIMR